jgi:hypothetical protein
MLKPVAPGIILFGCTRPLSEESAVIAVHGKLGATLRE